jgi:hypothetical protein
MPLSTGFSGRPPILARRLLAAKVPRAYLDLNRAADELDPAVIDGIDRPPHNPRISSGLGVIPRVVAGGRAIYRGKLTLAEAELRLGATGIPIMPACLRGSDRRDRRGLSARPC